MFEVDVIAKAPFGQGEEFDNPPGIYQQTLPELMTLEKQFSQGLMSFTQPSRSVADLEREVNKKIWDIYKLGDELYPMTTVGDMIRGGFDGVPIRLVGNITTTKKFLTQVGNGSIAGAPDWHIIELGDVPFLSSIYQPLDATLTALASQNWASNTIPIGNGADILTQVPFAANTFPARASTGNLAAKSISDTGLTFLAQTTQALMRTTGLGLGSLAVESSITVGTTTLSSGTNGRVLYQSAGVFQESANLTHDGTSLGVGGPTIGTINGVAFSTVRGHFKSAAGGYLAMDAAGTSGFMLNDSSQSADNRNWAFQNSGTIFGIATYTDAGFGTTRLSVLRTGEVGINTSNQTAKLTVGGTESATLTDFTQNISNNGVAILSAGGTYPRYTPGLMWYTASHPTKPKAGIWTQNTGSGSHIYLGTSNSYATGITNEMSIDPSGHVAIAGNLTLADAKNLIFNTTTGTKIGTATSQKIGLWNAAPIIQPTTGIASSVFAANTSGIVDNTATWDGYTMGQVVKALRNLGALA